MRLAAVLIAASALGFGLGYWVAAPSLLSPAALADLVSRISDRQAKQAAQRYEALQEQLKKQQERARRDLSKVQKDREKVARRLKETSRRLEVEREQSEKRVQDLHEQARAAEEAASEAQRVLEESIEDAGLDLSAELRAAEQASEALTEALHEEITELRKVTDFQASAILDQKAMIDALRSENFSLAHNLELSERRYEAAEGRIKQLSGRRLRLRPAFMVGAVRGFSGTWAPGFAVGLAITW